LTTTNGTECLLCAASEPGTMVLVGALVNASAVGRVAMRMAQERKTNITIVIAGRNNQVAPEDQIAATEIALAMPGAPFGGEIRLLSSRDYVLDFLNSDSGRNLCSLGRRDDVLFCANKDMFELVPIYRSGKISALTVAHKDVVPLTAGEV
jgi:phosphosulfolactate phosphohydrolase-like enzyme